MALSMVRYLMLFVGLMAAAHAAEQKATVDGMDVYYGIIPAEIVKKQADKDAGAMHSGPVRKNFRHLVVALYDAQSGQRLTDAVIDATVTPLGLAPSVKRLDPMRINDTVTYGNFFDFAPNSTPFRITLKVARPNRPTHEVAFEYRP